MQADSVQVHKVRIACYQECSCHS